MICKKLSPISVHFLSPLLIMSFDARKFWILMKFSVSVFSLVMLLMSYFKKHRLGFTPVSFWEFVILVLTCRSLIHFELIFRWCEIEVRFILLHVDIQLSSTICWKDHSFPIEWSWHLCQKSIGRRYMELFLDSQLYFIGLYIYPYANTTIS